MNLAPVPTPSEPVAPRPPRAVAAVVVLVLLEALLLAGLAVGMLVALVRGSELAGPVVFLVVLAAGMSALLVAAARGLRRGRRWARSPVMTWQVLLVVLSVGWIGVETAWWSVVVLVVAVLVGVGLLLPPVVAWTTTAPDPTGPDAVDPS